MRLIIGMALLAAVVGLALLRGGAPERYFAFILVAMLLVDRAGHQLLGNDNLAAIHILHLVIDLASFGAMMAVMIAARRIWPIWACSFQLLSLASHVTRALGAKLPAIVPSILGIAPSYGIYLTLVVATLLHARRKRRGSDPSWRTSLRPATARPPWTTPSDY